ncbi:hypothetical protein [Luteitalea sp.]|uniref:hypothetical protein n=1 Tax=Luteitalea sp. TaxID=2004800 RepID=UPI0025B7BFAF|nr:hypothetical protein [Luteitalea sp.]
MNATASAPRPGLILLSAITGIALLCLWVSTVLGESRGESQRPDDKAPRSKTEIKHEVKSRPDGVRIRISVRQETEGREASSERNQERERRPSQPPPVAVPDAPIPELTAEAPVPAPEPPPTADPPVPHVPSAEAPTDEATATDIPLEDVVATDAPAASAAPLFSRSVADEPSVEAPMEEAPPTDPSALVVASTEPAPAEAPVPDSPADLAPVAEAPPALFPTDPPFIELPAVTLPPSASRAAITPRLFVADVLEDIPLPAAKVRMNPDLGLVAVPTWFWVEGYDGRAFGVSRRINIPAEIGDDIPIDDVPRDDPLRRPTSLTIVVTVRPSRYEWSFGDGTRLVTTSLGKPYPRASDVKHTYEHSSLRSPTGFTVGLTIEFTAEYSINGGAVQALPPIRRSYESSYRVQEIQPVLTSR